MTDPLVFLLAFAKAALLTGLGQGVLMVYVAEKMVRFYRVPAHKDLLSWQVCMYRVSGPNVIHNTEVARSTCDGHDPVREEREAA